MRPSLRLDRSAAWHPTGLKITANYHNPFDRNQRIALTVEDLNPQQRVVYCGGRWELIRLGLWIALRALTARG